MNEQISEFNESDQRWIRADELRSRLGIKHAQFQRMHRSFGVAFEHRGDGKPGTPVWVYFPGWAAAWIRFESGPSAPANKVDQDERLKKLRADREELRLHRDREVLLHVKETEGIVRTVLSYVSRAGEKLDSHCQQVINEAIDEADRELMRQYGDGLQIAESEEERSVEGLKSGNLGGSSSPQADPS